MVKKKIKKIKKIQLLKLIFLLLIIIILIMLKIYLINHNYYVPFFNEKIQIEIGYNKDYSLKEYYLAKDDYISIYSNIDNINYKISDTSVAEIKDNKIYGLKDGTVTITGYLKDNNDSIKLTVTSLINKASLDKKSKLKCNTYSDEENILLDKILSTRVNESGYKTRAAAVSAARFLTMEFPYTIEYFYENGRLDYPNSGRRLADGEGRYYHEGLYLSNSKTKDIKYKDYGPAIWGCKLYERTRGDYENNGLDCSGFISWVLKQAGFDPGDVGAGIHKKIDTDFDDLGKKVDLNKDNKGKYKVGDLIGFNGHIAIIIGIDGDDFYIAESYTDNNKNSLHIDKYSFEELLKTKFKYVMLMDSYYKEDGNLTNWIY